MTLTPLDIKQQDFDRRLWGYSPDQVRDFLEAVALTMTTLTRELHACRAAGTDQARELRQLRGREESMRAAMLTAQRAIDEVRAQAHREAELIRQEAQLQADRTELAAQERLHGLHEQARDVHTVRVRLEEDLRGVLMTYARLLDAHASPPPELSAMGPARAPLEARRGPASRAPS